jgi:hypothetical protein
MHAYIRYMVCMRGWLQRPRLSPDNNSSSPLFINAVSDMDKDEKQLIDKVTENNESPAPGWALDQLARLTVQKPGIESEMAELLFKRLSKNSCDVKLKTLRAMHFISRRGSSSFRRACQHGSQIIRQHLSASALPQSSQRTTLLALYALCVACTS